MSVATRKPWKTIVGFALLGLAIAGACYAYGALHETIGAVTTAKWNHTGEEAYLCLARGDETRHWA